MKRNLPFYTKIKTGLEYGSVAECLPIPSQNQRQRQRQREREREDSDSLEICQRRRLPLKSAHKALPLFVAFLVTLLTAPSSKPAWANSSQDPILKKYPTKKGLVEHLPSKCEALSSSSGAA
jgi:hypothetical protein